MPEFLLSLPCYRPPLPPSITALIVGGKPNQMRRIIEIESIQARTH
jgi:hypothetical protein